MTVWLDLIIWRLPWAGMLRTTYCSHHMPPWNPEVHHFWWNEVSHFWSVQCTKRVVSRAMICFALTWNVLGLKEVVVENSDERLSKSISPSKPRQSITNAAHFSVAVCMDQLWALQLFCFLCPLEYYYLNFECGFLQLISCQKSFLKKKKTPRHIKEPSSLSENISEKTLPEENLQKYQHPRQCLSSFLSQLPCVRVWCITIRRKNVSFLLEFCSQHDPGSILVIQNPSQHSYLQKLIWSTFLKLETLLGGSKGEFDTVIINFFQLSCRFLFYYTFF